MSNNDPPPDSTPKFHTLLHPLRDLESNWAVDLSKNLENYLLKICSGELSGHDDDGSLSVNFAEAALLLQGSIQVYSRKVEYLYSLVLHALEFISHKSQQDQPESSSAQPEESSSHTIRDEENDPFWGLDDIPVDAKNSLDSATSRDAPLNHFVRPPANLVVLEGDCLDTSGDGGELESYLLATNDLYQDFILLDLCDSVAVDDFLKADNKASNWKNGVCRGSSLNTKSRKSFQSPVKGSGIGNSKDPNLSLSPLVDHCFQFNDPPADIPVENNHGFAMDDGYSEPRDLDDSDENGDDDDDDDDPWKPLNPHEPGNLKIKPYKKVKGVRREGVNSSKRIPLTTEFPLARLHGPVSSELVEIWEQKRDALERQGESQSPSLYEKLRESLVLGGQENYDAFRNFKDDIEEDDGFDSGGPDFDMPESTYMNEEIPLHPEKQNDGGIHFDANEDYDAEDPNFHASLEDLCRSHLDSLLDSIAETEKQTELAARVSTWKQRIEQNLEEQDSRPPFDIHEYSGRVLDKLLLEVDSGNALSFAHIVSGQEKHDIARTFSALLQLVNNRDVDLERVGSDGGSTCHTSENPFFVRLLRQDNKRQEELQFRSSKKRVKSPLSKVYNDGKRDKSPKRYQRKKPGKENCTVISSSPSGFNSKATLQQVNGKFSIKLGKIGGGRCTPEGKRRRRSRLVEPVDLHFAG